jgi:hypothetical protein
MEAEVIFIVPDFDVTMLPLVSGNPFVLAMRAMFNLSVRYSTSVLVCATAVAVETTITIHAIVVFMIPSTFAVSVAMVPDKSATL